MDSRRIIRSFVLLLAISTTLLASSLAASPAHFHQNNPGGGCDICSLAHLPIIQPSIAVHVVAPGVSECRITAQAAPRPAEPFVSAKSSRGPPSPALFA
jgi:hypothetical protein